jgi:hypothetical protein
VPYSAVTDLLLDDTNITSVIDKTQYVQDATDEIDSQIGFLYATPVDVGTVARPVKLLLKRINNWLATGHILATIYQVDEDGHMNQLAKWYLDQAYSVLKQIVEGQILLPIDPANPGEDEPFNGPHQFNEDSQSQVSAFYGNFTKPFGTPVIDWGLADLASDVFNNGNG